nr:hypothetical protein [Rhizobium sp. ACO-34A]
MKHAIACVFAMLALAPAQAQVIDVTDWARRLPVSASAYGVKVEPTYLASIEVTRSEDVFSILGGAPAWAERSRETVAVDRGGAIRHTECPPGMACSGLAHPAGFLSGAALLAALRAGQELGLSSTEPYGRFEVLCLPAEKLGIRKPILDPCFERASGLVIAHKNRFSHRIDGPSLDPATLQINSTTTFQPKDKAP